MQSFYSAEKLRTDLLQRLQSRTRSSSDYAATYAKLLTKLCDQFTDHYSLLFTDSQLSRSHSQSHRYIILHFEFSFIYIIGACKRNSAEVSASTSTSTAFAHTKRSHHPILSAESFSSAESATEKTASRSNGSTPLS